MHRAATLSPALVRRIVDTIVAGFDPYRIILFGSRARDDARPDSDLDLLVEIETELPRRERARRIRSAFDPYPWPMDIVVYTPAETEKWRQAAASLVSTVLREGKVLYERDGQGTGRSMVPEGGKRLPRGADHARS
jgi:predicted nucleotidyltransferase